MIWKLNDHDDFLNVPMRLTFLALFEEAVTVPATLPGGRNPLGLEVGVNPLLSS
jgi:hypothetical protein